MISIIIKEQTFLAIQIPDNWEQLSFEERVNTDVGDYIKLMANNFFNPEFKPEIIGTLSQLTEQECVPLVDRARAFGRFGNYRDYSKETDYYSTRFMTARESFLSLLTSKGIDVSKNQLLIKVK